MPKIKVKINAEAFAALPEALKAFYVADGDNHILQVEGVQEHPDTLALKTTLDRVRNEKKTVEEKLSTLEARVAGLPDDFNLSEYNKLKDTAGNAKDIDTRLNEQRERLTKEKETAVAAATTERDKFKNLFESTVSDAQLNAAIAESGIAKPFVPALRAMFKGKVKVAVENDESVVTIDNMPVAQAIKAFAESDDGKHYVVAPASGGGGGNGSGKPGEKPTDGNPWAKDSRNFTKQVEIEKSNPALAEKYKREAGVK